MKLDREQIDHLARIARLDLSDEERERYLGQLNTILEYVERIGALDTAGVEPMAHPTDRTDVSRKDVEGKTLDPEDALGGAPDAGEGFFRVPGMQG